jgi:hypothetical protein
MTELEEFTAGMLARWRGDGAPTTALTVGSLLDRVFPYRVARRELGIDVSEDYEALVLRLVAEEEGLIATAPVEAAEMARKTLASKLPDLDVLRVLRSATLTPVEATVSRLFDARPADAVEEDGTRWSRPQPPPPPAQAAPAPLPPAEVAPVSEALPPEPVANPAPVPEPVALPEPAVPVVTPHADPAPMPSPAADQCWSCQEGYPSGRSVKFCPFCGADQRRPSCAHCQTEVERNWKHCPECGAALWERDTAG